MIDPTPNQEPLTGLTTSMGARASTGNGQDRVHRFAGTMHQAIDRMEQRLTSAGGGMSSRGARYGEQARQYGDRLRTRMNEQPLGSVGVVLAAGVLLDRMFLRKTKVRTVKVPVRMRATWDMNPPIESRTRRWSDAADAHMQRVARTGQHVADRAGSAAAVGIAGTKAMLSSLAREANALPLQMRVGTQRLMARSQDYGSMARSTMQAHPWAGVGAVLAASGLLTSAVMRRWGPAEGTGSYTAMDARGYGVERQRSEYDTRSGLGEMVSSRPVTSSMVVLGLGMLAAMMLRRREY